jgi:uncharacterized integral membrane protein
MQLLKWIFALPLIIGAIFFAVANPDIVTVNFAPFATALNTPLYLICFLFLTGGFLLGTLLTWASGSDVRKERRKQKKEIKKLQKEIEDHHDKMAETLSKISPGTKHQDIIDHDAA